MLYRAVALFIVLFWLTMTGLLLHHVQPGDSALRAVPVGHVVKLLFHHRLPSDLNIANDKLRLGRLQIMPRFDKAAGLRMVAFSGSLHFPVPGAKSRRVTWDGEVEMNQALVTQRFRLQLTVHEPANLESEIVVLPAEKVAHYELRSPTGILERQSFPLDERGARALFQQFGLDPALLINTRSVHAAPVLKAQQSSLRVHGEQMDTYLVTLQTNGQTWLECHVNQLGQIMRATTLLGYTLTPDDITP